MNLIERADVLFQTMISRFMSIPARQRAGEGVSVAQVKALYVLEFRKSAALGDLARTLGITASAASELVDRLVRAGHVRRDDAPDDRRRVILSVTARGRTLLARFARQRQERFRNLARVIGAAGLRRMVAALAVLDETLSRWPGGTP